MLQFDPKKVGETEYVWWRAHHERNKPLMTKMLLLQNSLLYGLDNTEGQEILIYLIEAVKGHDLRDWAMAIDGMTKYYQVIKNRTKLAFDSKKVAEMEVGWWQLHDKLEHTKDKTPLSQAFAELYGTIFGVDKLKMSKAGEIKAQATYEHDLAEDPETPRSDVEIHWKNTKSLLMSFYSELLSSTR